MSARRFTFALVAGLFANAIAWPCSLCVSIVNRATLGEDWEQTPIVVVGRLANPQLGKAGMGTVDLHLEQTLKDVGGKLGGQKVVTLPRYVPIADPKRPPRYLVFLERSDAGVRFASGVPVRTPEFGDYVESLAKLRSGDRVATLVNYARHLDAADDEVANDAFTEFAKAKDGDVGEAGKRLDPVRVRKLVEGTKDSTKLSLFAFLLGCCGDATDAERLARIARDATGDRVRALDGVLAGLVALDRKRGWHAIQSLLSEPKTHFDARYAAWRSIRFLRGWRGDVYRTETLACIEPMIRDGEMADFAVEELRRAKWWELTPAVVSAYDRPTHKAPIVRNALIRYALACPSPEARPLVARARRDDPDNVADQEKYLKDLDSAP